MIDSVHDYPISQIFSKDANWYYCIPKYQREYTWSYSHWGPLFNDIESNASGYFIGSIICINNTHDSFQIKQLEVVDGQQRLTTLSILLAAIYTQLQKYKDYISDDDIDVLPSIRKSLRRNDAPNGLILQPQIQNYNSDDFSYLMQEAAILDVNKFGRKKAVSYYPQRKLGRCYNYYIQRLESFLKDIPTEEKVFKLLDIYNKINQAVLVKIEVSSHTEAYMLFEALNDRGTPLTAIDLMKNTILSKAKSNEEVDAYYEQWKSLIESLTDDYHTQERFFRHYYNAFKQRHNKPFISEEIRSKEPLGVIATKTNLLSIYEKLINLNLDAFITDITKCGQIYANFVNPNIAPIQFKDALLDLLHVQAVPANTLLLYLFYYQEELNLSDKMLNKIINLMVKFFVRRNITDTPNTYTLDRIFMSIISNINANISIGENGIYDIIYESLLEVSASDKDFAEKLSGNIYEENVGVTRFVLCKLCEKYMTTENWTNLWEQNIVSNKKIYVWTIEHIFPEGANIPESWVQMIANGDKELAHAYRAEYVHKIGNLTISGFNSTLSNKSFVDKRDMTNKKGLYVGYKNGLEINKPLAQKESWTIEDIKSRTSVFVNELTEMFKL